VAIDFSTKYDKSKMCDVLIVLPNSIQHNPINRLVQMSENSDEEEKLANRQDSVSIKQTKEYFKLKIA
jgi:hypothetical protein